MWAYGNTKTIPIVVPLFTSIVPLFTVYCYQNHSYCYRKTFLLFWKPFLLFIKNIPIVLKTADEAIFLARDVTDCSKRCVSYDDDDNEDDRPIMLKSIPIITKNHPYCVWKSPLRIRITGGRLQGDEIMP